MNIEQNYYEILGVPSTATTDEIRRAFQQKARRYHPDVCKDPDAEEKMKRISESYTILSNETKRRQYDARLRIKQQGQTSSPEKQASSSEPRPTSPSKRSTRRPTQTGKKTTNNNAENFQKLEKEWKKIDILIIYYTKLPSRNNNEKEIKESFYQTIISSAPQTLYTQISDPTVIIDFLITKLKETDVLIHHGISPHKKAKEITIKVIYDILDDIFKNCEKNTNANFITMIKYLNEKIKKIQADQEIYTYINKHKSQVMEELEKYLKEKMEELINSKLKDTQNKR
ncbi:MAG: DnaJ domain-containing protein [Bacilli bacterium]|nr:DnaJ domain-containing protein [Bacilli bacterium]